MVDIAEESRLTAYLADRGIVSPERPVRLRYFGGGVSGTVALVQQEPELLLVKQALETLKVAELWTCDPSRILVEKNALEVYQDIIPDCVPALVYYDEENYIMVREAAAEDWMMWKSMLLRGRLDFAIAERAVRALYTIHNETSGSAGIRERFQEDKFFYSLRISPYIEHVVKKYPQLSETAGHVIQMLMGEHIALIHGDFSPKNILTDGEQICILDLEVSYYGHPSFDTAFFSNHFLLKAVKNRRWSKAYLNMLSWMMKLYFANIRCMDAVVLEKQTIQVLAFMLLARVDGKSPAEYIVEEYDKALIREMAFTILDRRYTAFQQVIGMAEEMTGKDQEE